MGRDILIGCATGVAAACLYELSSFLPNRFGYPHLLPDTIALLDMYLLPSSLLHALARLIIDAVFISLAFFFLLFFLRMVLRNDALTGFVWVLLGVTLIVDWRSAGVWLSAPASLALWLMIYFVLLRVGFFPFLLGRFIAGILITAPITFHASAWYADIGYSALAVLAIIAVYGFWTSLAGQPALAFAGDGIDAGTMPTTS